MADAAPIWGGGAGCRRLLVALLSVGGFVAVRQTFVLGGQDTRLRAKAAAGTGLKRGLSANRLSRRLGCRKPGAASRHQTWRSPSTRISRRLNGHRNCPLVVTRGCRVQGRPMNGSDRGREGQMFGGKEQACAGAPRRLRGMTTILRKYHSVARCTPLGEMIEDTATRYYYRPHVGGELTFVDKELPAIHLTPCPACPDWPASQQRGSAVGTNS